MHGSILYNPVEKKEFKILYAEDDVLTQRLVLQYIKANKLPLEVEIAGSFEAAKDLLAKKEFDVILSDYFLGDGIGKDLIQYIADTPLVIITGAGDEETAIGSIKAGASNYLIKGSDHSFLNKLFFAIEKAMDDKKIERLLNMHSQAIQNIADSVFFIDTKNRFIYVNDAFCRTYRFEREEVIGNNIGVIWDGDKIFKKFFDKKLSGEYINKKSDGRLFPVSLSYTPIVDSKDVIFAAVGIVRDITEQKRIQIELKKHTEHLGNLVEERTKELRDFERLAAIGETATMVGHDLRNPLQVLVNSVYIGRMKIKKNKSNISPQILNDVESTFTIFTEQIEYMNKIVSDLQYFAKKIKPDLQTFDFPDFISKLITENVNFPDIKYEVEIDTNLKFLTIDKTLFQRVLINLMTNAKNAIEKGGIIKFEAEKLKGNCIISITDTGNGIPDNVKPNIFKPLFTTNAKGMGMGLSVCKRIIEAHGGSISIESVLGKGTKVLLILPQDLIEE